LHTESMPDNPNRIAFLYGPIVLAGQLGTIMPDPIYGTPVLLTENHYVNDWLKPVAYESLTFEMKGVGQPKNPILKPFYSTYDQYYSVYFDFFTPVEWQLRQKEYESEMNRQKEIEEMTIDNFRIGEMKPERDHHLHASEQSYIDPALGRSGREARSHNYFVFEMNVQQGIPNSLLLTYIGDDKDRKFDILVEGKTIATVDWAGGNTSKFYDVEYPIPGELVLGRQKVTVRIEANHGKTAGRVFGCRTIQGKAK
jgi:uncharacterized protein